VIYTIAPYLLPDLIPALNERAPAMPLEIEENLTENLETSLRAGRMTPPHRKVTAAGLTGPKPRRVRRPCPPGPTT
jgi:hypothetical protein